MRVGARLGRARVGPYFKIGARWGQEWNQLGVVQGNTYNIYLKTLDIIPQG